MATKKSALRSDAKGERITVYLSPELAQRLRIHCATERTSMSAVVSAAVTAALGKRKRGEA